MDDQKKTRRDTDDDRDSRRRLCDLQADAIANARWIREQVLEAILNVE